jgi:hypothetical protein
MDPSRTHQHCGSRCDNAKDRALYTLYEGLLQSRCTAAVTGDALRGMAHTWFTISTVTLPFSAVRQLLTLDDGGRALRPDGQHAY